MAGTKVHSGLTAVVRALGPAGRKGQTPGCWHKVILDSLSEVEELLDWLENSGCAESRVEVLGGEFVVRWQV